MKYVIRPWNKEAERVLRQISRYGRAYTTDTEFARIFGRKYKHIIDLGLIEIARSEKSKKTWIITPPDVGLAPIGIPDSRGEKFPIFRFFRLL